MLRRVEHRIAEARERTARLTVRSQSSSAQETEFVALQELSLTNEELASRKKSCGRKTRS
jgi:hypothetical protein